MGKLKISLKESLAITILITAVLFALKELSSEYYFLKIGIYILLYLGAIAFCYRKIGMITISSIVSVNRNRNIVLLAPLLIICFFGLIYSLQILLSVFAYGDTFSVNLKTYINGFVTAIIGIVIFPILEEFLFRKTFLQGLINVYSNHKGLIISSVMFSIVHWFSEIGPFIAFFAGLLFGYIYICYQSFIMSLSAHVLYNSLAFFVSPIVNKKLFAIDLNSVYMFFIPTLFLSSIFLIYLLKKLKKNV